MVILDILGIGNFSNSTLGNISSEVSEKMAALFGVLEAIGIVILVYIIILIISAIFKLRMYYKINFIYKKIKEIDEKLFKHKPVLIEEKSVKTKKIKRKIKK